MIWNYKRNTLEAFIYTSLEACNSITNFKVYQDLMNALHPFRIRKKIHF